MFSQQLGVKKFQHSMAIEPSVRHLGLVSKCDISYLLKTVMLFPLHGFAFHKVIISFCAS
jgi:hypothetical protein